MKFSFTNINLINLIFNLLDPKFQLTIEYIGVKGLFKLFGHFKVPEISIFRLPEFDEGEILVFPENNWSILNCTERKRCSISVGDCACK